jgi:hypothetical protein
MAAARPAGAGADDDDVEGHAFAAGKPIRVRHPMLLRTVLNAAQLAAMRMLGPCFLCRLDP